MRHFVPIVFMVLQQSAAAADQSIAIVEKTRWAQTRAEHKQVCGGNPNTEACTYFVDHRPSFICTMNDRQWFIDGSVRLTAMVVLRRPGTIFDKREILKHERQHMADVRGSLEQYIAQLGQQRFASDGDCRSAAAAETRAFKEKLREFARASATLRD